MSRNPDQKCERLDAQLRAIASAMPPRKGLAHSSFEAMILARGRVFRPAPLPARYERGEMRECYRNAYRLAASHPRLMYVEGFAARPGVPIAVAHAWCVRPGGWVVDPTWPDSEDCEYRGIVIDTLDLFKRLLQTRVSGVLVTEPRILRHADPIRGLRELIEKRVGAAA
jgi:hypothetical protein